MSDVSSLMRDAAPGAGLPGVCLSITEGANEHRLDEYIETRPVPTGVKNVFLATVALAGRHNGLPKMGPSGE